MAPFAVHGDHLLPIKGLCTKCSPLQEAACISLEKMAAGAAVCMLRIVIVAGPFFFCSGVTEGSRGDLIRCLT